MKAAGFVVVLCLLFQSQAFAQDPEQKAQASQHFRRGVELFQDFYTQKPPIGDTEVPALRVVSRAGLKALVDGFADFSRSQGVDQAVNAALANIYGLVFDCEDKLAGQVALTYTNAIGVALNPAPAVLYFNEQNVPSLTRKFSYPTGVFSTLNIALENINVATSLVVSADAAGTPTKVREIRNDYTMKLAAFRQTTVHFYPRNYTTSK